MAFIWSFGDASHPSNGKAVALPTRSINGRNSMARQGRVTKDISPFEGLSGPDGQSLAVVPWSFCKKDATKMCW
jgi:hypothetical protein